MLLLFSSHSTARLLGNGRKGTCSGVCQPFLFIDDCMETYLCFFDDNVSLCMYSSGILMHYIPLFY